MKIEYSMFLQYLAFFYSKFANFLSNFDEKLSEFRGKPQRMIKSVEILLKIHERIRKIAEIIGISEVIQFAD